jgi:hypothetical protein
MPIIVVGAVKINGERTSYSCGNNDDINTSAVGRVRCPIGESNEYEEKEGTSFGITKSLRPYNMF